MSKVQQEQMYMVYQPLIKDAAWKVVQKYGLSVDKLDDLFMCGAEAFLKVSKAHGANSEAQFKSYIYTKVWGSMLDYLRSLMPINPVTYRNVQIYRRLVEEHKGISDQDIMLRTGWGKTRLKTTKEYSAMSFCSYEEYAQTDTRIDTSPCPEEQVIRNFSVDRLNKAIAKELTKKQKQVIYLRYVKQMPMREIAEAVGVSEARVSQINKKALEKLRKDLIFDDRN